MRENVTHWKFNKYIEIVKEDQTNVGAQRTMNKVKQIKEGINIRTDRVEDETRRIEDRLLEKIC